MNSEKRADLIGLRIQEARRKAGMSQMDLAKAVGFESATAISLIENGERRIAVDTLERIATVLHEDVKSLLGQKADEVPVLVALRADKDLGDEEKDYIRKFIENAKRQHGKG